MLSSHEQADLERQVEAARLRMLLEHVELAMLASGLFAAVVAWLIHDMVGDARLWPWLVVKLVCLAPRVMQARWYLARGSASVAGDAVIRRHMTVLVALDGAVWGAAVWWLTPLHDLALAVITLSCIMGVGAVGAFMNAMDTRILAAFVLPMLLPNAFYALARQDSVGLFGALSIAGFLAVMVLESRRWQRRISELLRLRFTTEKVAAERAQALDEARLHGEAKSRFLATVSHEMRTPLHGILGLARVLQQEQPRADQQQRLALVERSGEHLLTVINDILDFSKIEAGRMELTHGSFDLTAVLQDAAGVFQVLAQGKDVPLRLSLPWTGPCHVEGDVARVRQILHNLLGNAVKFTDQGSIQLSVSRLEADRFEIAVRDTGPGIAEQDRERIFEAFVQAPPGDAGARPRQGTGLGLSIARQLCQAMDGSLQCDSAVGVGSVFRAVLRLPRLAVGDAGLADGLPPLDVLLVEDNPVNVLVAEAVLANLGCRVTTVGDGQQAVAWLDKQPCDVVLMDCDMPVMGGMDATREIRRREQAGGRSRVPIVALTAHLLADEQAQCLQAGMDACLGKPFGPDDLRRVLRAAAPHVLGAPSSSSC